jgi:hypothetical protein
MRMSARQRKSLSLKILAISPYNSEILMLALLQRQ